MRSAQRSNATVRWVLETDRRSIMVWSAAASVVSGFYAVFWGIFSDLDDLTALIASLPDGFTQALGYDQIGTAAGYLDSTVYSLLAPILLSVFGLVFAGRVLAGAEERGDLELEFAAPVSRTRLMLQRAVATMLALLVASSAVGVMIVAVVLGVGMDVSLVNVGWASVGLFLYASAIAMITLAAGAATGRRALALGAGAAVAVGGFVFNAVSNVVDQAWLTWFSPLAWLSNADVLRSGFAPLPFLGLVIFGTAVLSVGLLRFARRDLGV